MKGSLFLGSFKNKLKSDKKGVTLLEIVIGAGLVAFLSTALVMMAFNTAQTMAESKQRIGAVSIANEKMELIRNLPYDQIGHPDWIPNGPISQTETANLNGSIYDIDILISYQDDEFDGTESDDDYENDYKQARILVSWPSGGEIKSVLFLGNFVPSGLESEAGGGVLSVNVIDSASQPIAGATVGVDSVEDSPSIHGSTITDEEGNVRLPGIPLQTYRLTVSKSGYETVRTYPDFPESSFNPIDKDVIVVEGVVAKTFTLQEVGSLSIKAEQESDGSDVEGLEVEIRGGRVIGSDPETLAFDQTEETDSDGEIELSSLSPGEYEIVNLDSLETSTLRYVGSDSSFPINVQSESAIEVNLIFADKEQDSLLVKVVDDATGNPIEGATVEVDGTSFSQDSLTASDGGVFFPIDEDPPVLMTAGEYSVQVSASGYNSGADTVDVSDLTETEIRLLAL